MSDAQVQEVLRQLSASVARIEAKIDGFPCVQMEQRVKLLEAGQNYIRGWTAAVAAMVATTVTLLVSMIWR